MNRKIKRRIAVMNKKGGVGKTPTAKTLAVDLDYYIISNDESTIEALYPERAKVMDTPVLADEVVYDFGGFADSGVLAIIKECDLVYVPCINTPDSIKRTYQTIKEIEPYNANIAVIVTKTEVKTDIKKEIVGDFDEVKNTLEKHFNNIKFFELKLSKAFKHQEQTGQSLSQIINENGMTKWAYRDLNKQYSAILDYAKNSVGIS
jgi:MinD-like ATPase involved in chromosome partitioning or flagellar assembly